MKVLALNATYRPEGTTARLVQKALEGAASAGAEVEHLLLKDSDIRYCTNCLKCYNDLEADIAPCVHDDDMTEILEKIKEADGVILASPVHSSFLTGLMTVFIERATWRLCRPLGELLGLKGCPEPRLTDKVRASASIVSAGMVPEHLREYCDQGTPFLQSMAPLLFDGEFVADMYAAAYFHRELTEEEWKKGLLFRELTETQLKQAHDLGEKLAQQIEKGQVRPYDPSMALPEPMPG